MDNVVRSRELFRIARDIPYRVALNENEQDYCCATKPTILATLLLSVSIESRRRLCYFGWSETPVPPEIIALAPSPDDTHEYLECRIPKSDAWVVVDPSWDIGLSRAGFKISSWDGYGNTIIGVKPTSVLSVEESADLIRREEGDDPDVRRAYLIESNEFFTRLNQWMASIRA